MVVVLTMTSKMSVLLGTTDPFNAWGSAKYSSRFATGTSRTHRIGQRGREAGLLGPTKSRLGSNFLGLKLGRTDA